MLLPFVDSDLRKSQLSKVHDFSWVIVTMRAHTTTKRSRSVAANVVRIMVIWRQKLSPAIRKDGWTLSLSLELASICKTRTR